MAQDLHPPRQPRATMRDVAGRACVSVMTVSRVVNGSGGVEPATRSRVESAIAELGYRQNEAASALRRTGARTRSLGLVVDDIGNPFCSALQRGVERACHAHGLLLVAGSSAGDPGEERSLVAALLRRRVDGLVVMGSDPDQGYLADEARRGVPSVFVDRRPSGLVADHVVTDNAGAATQATAHLLAHGHRRIALLAYREAVETSRQRRAGYREALLAAGVDPEPRLEVCDVPDAATAARRLGALLDGEDPPSAVFAAQNLLGLGAVRALHERCLQHRVALVMFDDVDLADLLQPPVTVVRQDADGIGARAAEILLRRLAGDASDPVADVVPARLVARGSGELPGPFPRRAQPADGAAPPVHGGLMLKRG